MNGEIATFKLSSFDEFITIYKANKVLAPEALEAFNQFLTALSRFFNCLEEFTNNDMNDEIITIKWYSSAIISSGDTILIGINKQYLIIFQLICTVMKLIIILLVMAC